MEYGVGGLAVIVLPVVVIFPHPNLVSTTDHKIVLFTL